jgi:hypothetical protein
MAMYCAACGGVIPDITNGGVFTGCDKHIKPEINIGVSPLTAERK